MFFLIFLTSFVAVTVIWIRTETVKQTYAYVRSEKEYRQIQQDIQTLRIQYLKLTSPKRLEALAQSLGLKPARLGQILKYEPERMVSNP